LPWIVCRGSYSKRKVNCFAVYISRVSFVLVVIEFYAMSFISWFDRVLFLHEGKVVWQGPTAEFETTTNPIVRQVCLFILRSIPDELRSVVWILASI
jgi:hypothetical protein